jgi:predicted ATPase
MDKKLESVDKIEITMCDLKTLIDDAVHAGRQAEKIEVKKSKNPNYAETERLLYKYPILKLKVEQDELDIKDYQKEMEQFGSTQKSKDIVYVPTGGIRLDPQEKQEALIADKEASKSRTLKEIAKIDKALEKVSNYKGYEIINLKYFKRIEPDEEIMDELHIGKTTFYQWKNRLINDLSVIFFGE